jgi:hypothetical protein
MELYIVCVIHAFGFSHRMHFARAEELETTHLFRCLEESTSIFIIVHVVNKEIDLYNYVRIGLEKKQVLNNTTQLCTRWFPWICLKYVPSLLTLTCRKPCALLFADHMDRIQSENNASSSWLHDKQLNLPKDSPLSFRDIFLSDTIALFSRHRYNAKFLEGHIPLS